MTLYVDETLIADIYLNIPNQSGLAKLTITSQWSHQPLGLIAPVQASNDRYTWYRVSFPVGFAESHKNGIYYYEIEVVGQPYAFYHGLVKIITEPGGEMGTISYNAGPDAEERVADVFYRPNY